MSASLVSCPGFLPHQSSVGFRKFGHAASGEADRPVRAVHVLKDDHGSQIFRVRFLRTAAVLSANAAPAAKVRKFSTADT